MVPSPTVVKTCGFLRGYRQCKACYGLLSSQVSPCAAGVLASRGVAGDACRSRPRRRGTWRRGTGRRRDLIVLAARLADGRDLPQPPGGGAAPVFVSHFLLCDVRFAAARARLAALVSAGWLTPASAAAWAGGLAALPGFRVRRDDLSALARVCLLAPAAGTGIVTLPLRWETSGPVRVLNAGLTLMQAGPAQTLVRLDGMVRLPHAAAGHRSGRDAGAPGRRGLRWIPAGRCRGRAGPSRSGWRLT